MTLSLFLTLVSILSIISSVLTEAIKKSFQVTKPTLVVAVLAIIVGWGGGAMAYVFMHVPFETAPNLICLGLLAPSVFLSATLGYDKVVEIIKQITIIK